MRVIAGSLGGRLFASPRTHRTHPMSDKMRGALFNVLGDIAGLTVLDAFAGSGALSFEAISRGASMAIAIESDSSAQRTIQENIRQLHLERRVRLVKAGCSSWSDRNLAKRFDIVLADPPYDKLQSATLERLVSHVQPDGLLVLSWPSSLKPPTYEAMELLEHKQYGDGQLLFFRSLDQS